jgi:hypothetical protein
MCTAADRRIRALQLLLLLIHMPPPPPPAFLPQGAILTPTPILQALPCALQSRWSTVYFCVQAWWSWLEDIPIVGPDLINQCG